MKDTASQLSKWRKEGFYHSICIIKIKEQGCTFSYLLSAKQGEALMGIMCRWIISSWPRLTLADQYTGSECILLIYWAIKGEAQGPRLRAHLRMCGVTWQTGAFLKGTSLPVHARALDHCSLHGTREARDVYLDNWPYFTQPPRAVPLWIPRDCKWVVYEANRFTT